MTKECGAYVRQCQLLEQQQTMVKKQGKEAEGDLDDITGSEIALIPLVLGGEDTAPEEAAGAVGGAHIYLNVL